jgi:hypothetical protein
MNGEQEELKSIIMMEMSERDIDFIELLEVVTEIAKEIQTD